MNDVKSLRKKLKKLRARLADTEQTLEAIRTGKVDALMVHTSEGEQVFTLRGADHPYRVMVEQMAEGAVTFDARWRRSFAITRFAELLHVPPETNRRVPNLFGYMLGARAARLFKISCTVSTALLDERNCIFFPPAGLDSRRASPSLPCRWKNPPAPFPWL